MLSTTYLDFISDVGITDHKHYNRLYRKQNRESLASGMVFTT